MRFKQLSLLIAGIVLSNTIFSQDKSIVQYAKISAKDFETQKSSIIDDNSNAVILSDIGSIDFVGSKHRNWVSYVYRKHERIKIINKKGIDLATVRIRLHVNESENDELDSLQGSTYNIENGQLVETKLNVSDVFDEKINKNNLEKRFAMPGVKEGSIIEYSYVITSPRAGGIPSWSFQHVNYPCIYSDFTITVPSMLSYLMIYHGQDSFAIRQTEKLKRKEYKMQVRV